MALEEKLRHLDEQMAMDTRYLTRVRGYMIVVPQSLWILNVNTDHGQWI